MQTEDTERLMQEWIETEAMATFGTSPVAKHYEPTGPNAWFGYAVAEVAYLFGMRRMSQTWQDRPPYPEWREYAPAIGKCADEQVMTAQTPPHMTLAQWFSENEPLLQQDPSLRERYTVVAAALLPLFENEPQCWEAIGWCNDDFSCGSFLEYLRSWHTSVPEKHRPFVRQIAGEFGMELDT